MMYIYMMYIYMMYDVYMHMHDVEKIQPTIGMNLAKIFYLNTQIIIWDLGGQLKMRNIWERYYNTGE